MGSHVYTLDPVSSVFRYVSVWLFCLVDMSQNTMHLLTCYHVPMVWWSYQLVVKSYEDSWYYFQEVLDISSWSTNRHTSHLHHKQVDMLWIGMSVGIIVNDSWLMTTCPITIVDWPLDQIVHNLLSTTRN